jgi:putative DNA methylase
MIEKKFDIPFIADLALREKQIQQNYRPIIAVHKWFARRPGTLFRGLLLSEFAPGPLRQEFYQPHDLAGVRICDPFMGGGTPLLEANRVGCDIVGYDINPMAYWIVKQAIDHLDLEAYDRAADFLRQTLEKDIGNLYRTTCLICGNAAAPVKYFLWVKTLACRNCGKTFDLFPGYLLAANTRHPHNVFICPVCSQLTESADRKNPGNCSKCGANLFAKGPARRNRCRCPHCGGENLFPSPSLGPPEHRLFALEYYCPLCKSHHQGRFFKVPDAADLNRLALAAERWAKLSPRYVPDEEIPGGDETNRLHRWGYRRYREMFNARQLLGLELSARIIAAMADERVRNALATNLSDLLRYQNMLCRYDPMALKSLDIFSVHGFPVGLVQCESNLLGIFDAARNICIGSGGWRNIIDKFRKAKSYCEAPFEVRHLGHRKEIIPMRGEWLGEQRRGPAGEQHRRVEINCGDATTIDVADASLDAVFTDPPYFGNVQYAELMDFCYVWLRRLLGEQCEAFRGATTRNPRELTGNMAMGRDLEHFTEGLAAVFQRLAPALKPGAPFAFTYHHNEIEAYFPVAVAILDAGLTCSAALPCPAEMGASIHINGTASSIIDTIFVCRKTGVVSRKSLCRSPAEVARLVQEDLTFLKQGNVKPSLGDTRCLAYGHLIRLAIWQLRETWQKTAPTRQRLEAVAGWLREFGGWPEVAACLQQDPGADSPLPLFRTAEHTTPYGIGHDDVPF